MPEIRINLVSLGYMPHFVDFERMRNWKSKVFRVVSFDRVELLPNSDGWLWSYTDAILEEKVPMPSDADLTLALINLPLEDNYYARRIADNRIAISAYEIADILIASDIPLENYVLRMLYKYATVFKRYGRIPVMREGILSHDETRVCLFDMTPMKTAIIYSTERLGLCEECRIELKKSGVSTSFLDKLEGELKKVRKGTYYRILGFIKRRPILAIAISVLSAILVNLLSSVLYEFLVGLFE